MQQIAFGPTTGSIVPDSLVHGDCLEVMQKIPAQSVDTIICDLPYGTTRCAWDIIIPFDQLWAAYDRILKKDGTVLLFGAQPFTTDIIASNRKAYRFCWYWRKEKGTGFLNVSSQPLREIEEIVVFYRGSPKYDPQMILLDKPYTRPLPRAKSAVVMDNLASFQRGRQVKVYTHHHPSNVLDFPREKGNKGMIPTQKPIALLEYLVKTHSRVGDIVLDNTMGSGTTGIACRLHDRRFIGIELDENHYSIACDRILATGRAEPKLSETDFFVLPPRNGLTGS